ncbi:MAG: uracil phosphoribosyltransferase [Bacteroidetes bacterium]|nr:uracil phosphoribosyltransferase [Bacteroidota bacterium]
MLHILGEKNSLFNQFLSELRDEEVQLDRMRFRRNLERIGEIFAYELSKELKYEEKKVTTPLGVATMNLLSEQPVIATILRAGLPFHQGFLNYFDQADNGFISAYRKYEKNEKFDIRIDYMSCPELENRVLVLNDVMLASGLSVVKAYKELLSHGKPSHIHVAAVLASVEGVELLKKSLPSKNVSLWIGAIDDELTAKSYIVPGLGDAGDLAYGTKI